MLSSSVTPLIYSPEYEKPEKDEAETAQGLTNTMLSISGKTYKNGGHPLRSVHAKSHGLLTGQMTVPGNLPPTLAQGIFVPGKTYPIVMRFSTTPGDITDDSVTTPRGLALKVLNVEGARLPGSENHTTQDFVMVNGPAFQVATAKTFLTNLKLLAATTDTPQIFKKVISATMRGAEKVSEAFGHESPNIKSMGGQLETHLLGDAYFTQVPMLYGDYMVKLCVAPVSPNLTALSGEPLDLNGKPTGLRDAMNAFFAGQGGEWEVRVQFCTNLETMPIEDASKVWPEDESPYIAVARITVDAQAGWTEAKSTAIDDGLSFSPWHGVQAHRPIGSIMRTRKMAYESSSAFRAAHSGCPMHEPRSLDQLAS